MRIVVCIYIVSFISIQGYCQERWEHTGILDYTGKLKIDVFYEDTIGRNVPDQTLFIEDGRIIENIDYKLTGVHITENVYRKNHIIKINKFKNNELTESYQYDYHLPDSVYVYRSINQKEAILIERRYFKNDKNHLRYNDVFNTKIEWSYIGDTLTSECYYDEEDSLTCSKTRKLKEHLVILEKYSCQNDFEIVNEYFYDQKNLIRFVTTSSKVQGKNESVMEIFSYSNSGQLEVKYIIREDKSSIRRVFYRWEFID